MHDTTPSPAVTELLRRLDSGEVLNITGELEKLNHDQMHEITEILCQRAKALEASLRNQKKPS